MCGPEFSDLESAIRQRYPEQDVAVFGLNAGGDGPEDLQVFMDAFQVSFPILVDANPTYSQYRQSGATSPYPLDYVIDQEGRVAYFSTEYEPEAMIAVIDGLLGQTSATPGHTPGRVPALSAAPNPFNPRVAIRFTLEKEQAVSLAIMDARGRRVRSLLSSAVLPGGEQNLHWDGTDDTGRHLPSGLYLAVIRTLDGTDTTKLTLIR